MAAYRYQEKTRLCRNHGNPVKIRGWGYKMSQNLHANNMYPNIFCSILYQTQWLTYFQQVFRPWFFNFNNI